MNKRMKKSRAMETKLTIGILGFVLLCCGFARGESPYNIAWSRQLGTSSTDYCYSVAVDGAGNAFIGGYTDGDLGGTNAGSYDVFLSKYDSAGNWQWTQQLGTSSNDRNWSGAVDATGNAFISGYTEGSLGGTNLGSLDAFLVKYNSDGNLQWKQQLGTSVEDSSNSVAVDSEGNAYISGYTKGVLGAANFGGADAFITKYNSAGTLQWTRQLGTSEYDGADSVAVDGAGNVFISGRTWGSLSGTNEGEADAFLSKYNSMGNLEWTQQLGTSSDDGGHSVAVDGAGNAFISGWTYGDLAGANAGDADAFLSKYDSTGNLEWTQQLGTSSFDASYSVAVDGAGNVFISGETWDTLGLSSAGSIDSFLSKYDSDGNLLWTHQLGTSNHDRSRAIAIDADGNPFISGRTLGSLGGENAGGYDAFLVKYAVPEPATLSLLVIGGLAMLRRKRK